MLPAFFIRSRGLGKLYAKLFSPLLERCGLTQTEADILLFLANNPEFDTARDMVEKRHLAKSHISAGIEALAERGLLERRFYEGNRKTIHLRLTEKAWPVVEEGRSVQRRFGELVMKGFSREDAELLWQMLDRVAENVDEALAGLEARG